MMECFRCSSCDRPYPAEGVPYRCVSCGGVYDVVELPPFDPTKVETELPGMWRYRHTFGLPVTAPVVSLGEGLTPVVWESIQGKKVVFKLEYLNPTGSFKDRGTAPLVSLLKSRQVRSVVEDSSGNAGASLAAYAARSHICVKVFVPAYASGPKLKQISAYGAEIVPVEGKRSDVAEAVRKVANGGRVYASHAYLPFGWVGMATIAYELVAQIGMAPGSVIAPAGQGSLLLGIGLGFRALQQAGILSEPPQLVGVQAQACAPLWMAFAQGANKLEHVTEGETLAEGVRICHPLRVEAVLRLLASCRGKIVAVEERDILPSRDSLAWRGFYVEPTSAIVWPVLLDLLRELPEPVVVVLTGSGFKWGGT
ncbi:MAG: pyridoxal-phosphate dependent enzyme [Chloroflexota bacterium]